MVIIHCNSLYLGGDIPTVPPRTIGNLQGSLTFRGGHSRTQQQIITYYLFILMLLQSGIEPKPNGRSPWMIRRVPYSHHCRSTGGENKYTTLKLSFQLPRSATGYNTYQQLGQVGEKTKRRHLDEPRYYARPALCGELVVHSAKRQATSPQAVR